MRGRPTHINVPGDVAICGSFGELLDSFLRWPLYLIYYLVAKIGSQRGFFNFYRVFSV
jgi:hypothetical protein